MRILINETLKALFPDSPYGNVSGGNPDDIPTLTFEELQEFYKLHYHPSNAKMFLYGDDDEEWHLGTLDGYLNSSTEDSSEVVDMFQPRIIQPQIIHKTYAIGESGDPRHRFMFSIGWVFSERPVSLHDDLIVEGLTILLSRYLKQMLLENNIYVDLHERLRRGSQHSFMLSLLNLSEKEISKCELIIWKGIENFAKDGYNFDDLTSVVKKFRSRTTKTTSGLHLLKRTMWSWQYKGDPIGALCTDSSIAQLVEILRSRSRVSKLIKKLFLENTHRATVTFEPVQQEHDDGKIKFLRRIQQTTSTADLERFRRATKNINEKILNSSNKQQISTPQLPAMPHIDAIQPFVELFHGVTIYETPAETNGVLYINMAFDISALKHELLPLIPFICGQQYLDQVREPPVMHAECNFAEPICASIHGRETPCNVLMFRIAGPQTNAFEIFEKIVLDVLKEDYDEAVFRNWLLTTISKLEGFLRGYEVDSMVQKRLHSKLNSAGVIMDSMGGFRFLEALRKLQSVDWSEVKSSLLHLKQSLPATSIAIQMAGEKAVLTKCRSFLEKIITKFKQFPLSEVFSGTDIKTKPSKRNEAIVTTTLVNTVGRASNIYANGYVFHGSAIVIQNFIESMWLLDNIRTLGGAYGVKSHLNPHSGVFSMVSNSDPNILDTLSTYKRTIGFMQNLKIEDDTLKNHIYGVAKGWRFVHPGEACYESFLRYLYYGSTENDLLRRREEVLKTSLSDFRKFADALQEAESKSVTVVVGSAEAVEAAQLFEVKKL